jgi:hypothetical protein
MYAAAMPDLTSQPPASASVEEFGTHICELHLTSARLTIDLRMVVTIKM